MGLGERFHVRRIDGLLPERVSRNAGPRGVEATDDLVVVGAIDPATNLVELAPLFVLKMGEISERIPGPYAIVLRDGTEAELARYPFTPRKAEPGVVATDQIQPDTEVLSVMEVVPFVDGTARVDIEGPSGLLHTVTAGAGVPTVKVSAPNGGEVLDGQTVNVSWSADDPDGDELIFKIQYSPDNGATWRTVAQDVTGTTAEVDAINLVRSEQGLFRVLATDGVHTAGDDSDAPFTVPNRIPTARITEPGDDLTVATGQTLTLAGEAFDPDSGMMDGSLVEWVSSLDGSLGTGAELSVTGLGVGVHTITLRAAPAGDSKIQDPVVSLSWAG
jgi:hypothetical protein